MIHLRKTSKITFQHINSLAAKFLLCWLTHKYRVSHFFCWYTSTWFIIMIQQVSNRNERRLFCAPCGVHRSQLYIFECAFTVVSALNFKVLFQTFHSFKTVFFYVCQYVRMYVHMHSSSLNYGPNSLKGNTRDLGAQNMFLFVYDISI